MSAISLDFVSIQVELMPMLESMRRQQKKRARSRPSINDLHEWFVQLRAEVLSVIMSSTGKGSATAPSVSNVMMAAQKFIMMVRYSRTLIDIKSLSLLFFL